VQRLTAFYALGKASKILLGLAKE